MNPKIPILAGTACLLVTTALAGCQTTQETAQASRDLPPIELPAMTAGTEWTWQTPDGEVVETLVSAEEGSYRFADSTGCRWELPDGRVFAPSLTWSNCKVGNRMSTGRQTVGSEQGSIWPLQTGAQSSWSFTGGDETYDWSSARRCEAEGPVDIVVPAGTFTAQEVVCHDDYNTRTWWIAPEIGPVAYTRVSKSRGLEEDMKLISREVPST